MERGDLRSQAALLEEQLEAARLQAAAAAVAGAGAGAAAVAAAGGSGGGVPEGLLQDLQERQRASEARATQLEATSRWGPEAVQHRGKA